MAKKRIIDLPNLDSGSVNTILVGHDNGTTYNNNMISIERLV
jgi:hypothetical protein